MDFDYADLMERWQDFVRLDIAEPALKAQVEQTFADLWAIPEMREQLRLAYGNNEHRPVRITADPDATSFASPLSGRINLDPEEIATTGFRGQNGDVRWSVTHILVHELFHRADPSQDVSLVRDNLTWLLSGATENLLQVVPDSTDLDHPMSQRPRAEDLLRAVATVSGNPALIAAAHGRIGQFPEIDTDEGMDAFIDQMALGLEAVLGDPVKLREVETLLALPPNSLRLADSAVLEPRLRAFTEQASFIFAAEDEHGIEVTERNATDWTDYIMGRYFSEEPRKSYNNDTTLPHAPLTVSIPSYNPDGQRFEFMNIYDMPDQFVPKAGTQTIAEIIKDIDVGWQK